MASRLLILIAMSQTILDSSPLAPQDLGPLPLNPTMFEAVSWAARRQTKDFSPSDIVKTLARENCHLRPSQVAHGTKILRDRGDLETIVPARGRTAPVFRYSGHLL